MKREQTLFLVRFIAALALFYLAIAVHPVNDHVVVPFTALVVRVSTWLLNLLGEQARAVGTMIESSSFAVDVKNGCNGLEAVLLLVAAVLAFPASARQRLLGILAGFVAIQALNLVRVVSLFWLGVHHRAIFELFHAAIWQTVLILIAVALFFVWSRSVVRPKAAA